MNNTEHNFINLWGIHGQENGGPFLLGWKTSQSEAEEWINKLKNEIDNGEHALTEVWQIQMTAEEAESYFQAGIIDRTILN